MNRMLYFIKKESLHILRDVRTLLVVIGIPIVLMLLFGFAISTDINNVSVAVCAPERSASIDRIVSRISHNEMFTFNGYVDTKEIDEVLRRSEAGAVIVFAQDFDRITSGRIPGEKAVQIVLDGSNPNVAASAEAFLTVQDFSQSLPLWKRRKHNPFCSPPERTHRVYNRGGIS